MRSLGPHDASRTAVADAPDARVGADFTLPLRRSDFDAMLGALYPLAINGESVEHIHAELCRRIGALLGLPLVVLGRALDSGVVSIEGSAQESALWLEFLRLPERWDDGIASLGPAGAALTSNRPAHVKASDEGFALWRSAALKDLVTDVIALPLLNKPRRVLELFFDKRIPEGARSGTMTVAQLAERTAAFLDDLDSLGKSMLAARALRASGAAAFITDLEATIVWCNPAFLELSGYAESEVIGRKPSMLRSGAQGLRYYRDLWQTIRAGKSWTSETVDRDRDGREYAILQTVSPVPTDGRATHYVSVHQDIGRLRRQREQLQAASRQDPDTGLLTLAAFESDAAGVLRAATETAQPAVVVLASLRDLAAELRRVSPADEAKLLAEVGRRFRASAPWLTGAIGECEYAMVFADAEAQDDMALAGRLAAISVEFEAPLETPAGPMACTPRFATARFPADGTSLQQLLFCADRRLANVPFSRARRRLTHGDPGHDH